MEIRTLELLDGARQAQGLTVIIDVFRAFSTACYVANNGAARILPVGDSDGAYELKEQNPSFLLMGERGGKRLLGFDFGNSPSAVEHVDFSGRTVVHRTNAGTPGIANAQQASEIITGGFVNAPAIVSYIRSRQPQQVSLVAMGTAGTAPTDEDTLCAHYIKDSLQGRPVDFEQTLEHLRGYESARNFFDPTLDWVPRRDFDLCLDLGRFDFVLKAYKEVGRPTELRKVTIG